MKDNQWWKHGALKHAKGFLNMRGLNELKSEDIPVIADKYSEVGCNFAQVPVMELGCGCGADPDAFYFRSATQPNNNPDLLEVIVKEFHKRNIRVIAYIMGHAFVPEFYTEHPDWVMYTEDGKPHLSVFGTGASACLNNAGFRAWQAGIIKDLCAYEIDGVFLDGNLFFPKTCFCEVCQNLFRDRYGFDMPLKSNKKDSKWRYLREFQIDSVTEYVGFLQKTLKERRPNAILYYNSGLRAPNWTTGRQNRRLMEVQDILLSEGGFLYYNLNVNSPIWRTECENKLSVTQSSGKPVVCGMCTEHKRWNWYQLPSAEPRLMLYSALAAGSHLSVATSGVQKVSEVMKLARNAFEFATENEKELFPSVNSAKLAIVWSNINADFYEHSSVRVADFSGGIPAAGPGDLHIEFEGFYDSCFRNGIASDVIDEISITDGSLKKYDLVILPNIACLSELEIDCLQEYVRNGGTLVSTFETSLYDEYGQKRSDFGLSCLFGTSLDDTAVEGPLMWDYVLPAEGQADYLGKVLDGYRFLPSSKYRIRTVAKEAEVLLDCAEPLAGSYDGFPGRKKNGYMYINNYGKGRSVYFSGTFGQALMEWHFPEYYDILRQIFKENVKQDILLENSPESVSINIRKNPETGCTLVYLTNYTAAMTRPIRKITMLYNVKLKLLQDISEARSLFLKDNIKVRKTKHGTVITIKKLDEFEVIELKP